MEPLTSADRTEVRSNASPRTFARAKAIRAVRRGILTNKGTTGYSVVAKGRTRRRTGNTRNGRTGKKTKRDL